MTHAWTADRLVVAIDGPSGSGKSTVARRVASALGVSYLDTGSLYRALTWACLHEGIDISDPAAVSAFVASVELRVGIDPAHPSIAVAGRGVDAEIRTAAVTQAVSAVSAIPNVRAHLLTVQHGIISAGGIVVEGRDIGSVVVPDADVKIFLTASDDARARRRSAEQATDVAETRRDLARRDHLDSTRAASPLIRGADALEIDSSILGIDDVVARILAACEAAATRLSAAHDGALMTGHMHP